MKLPAPSSIRASATLLLLTCALILLLECVARLVIFGPRALFPRYGGAFYGRVRVLQQSTTPGLKRELIPNLRTYKHFSRFSTNSVGMMGEKEYSLEKTKSLVRVAIIGTSFSVAAGVEPEEAYHRQLEERLNQQYPNRFEFLNFSVPGYKLEDLVQVVEQKAVKYQPDLYLIERHPNTIVPRTASTVKKLDAKDYIIKRPVEVWLWNWVPFAFIGYGRGKPNYERFEQLIEQLSKFRSKYQTELVFFSPMRKPCRSKDCEIYASLLRKKKLLFVDTCHAFKKINQALLRINRIDSHPNPRAHKIYAEELYNAINWASLLGKQSPRKLSSSSSEPLLTQQKWNCNN